MISVSIQGLTELVADLDRAGRGSLTETQQVVAKGALNIKKDWAQRWTGHAHAPALGSTVTYDVSYGLGSIGAEIGPDKNIGVGPLGNIYEFGTPRNSPRPGGLPALQAEEPRFAKALEDMAGKLLDG